MKKTIELPTLFQLTSTLPTNKFRMPPARWTRRAPASGSLRRARAVLSERRAACGRERTSEGAGQKTPGEQSSLALALPTISSETARPSFAAASECSSSAYRVTISMARTQTRRMRISLPSALCIFLIPIPATRQGRPLQPHSSLATSPICPITIPIPVLPSSVWECNIRWLPPSSRQSSTSA